jgi:hypothetical protein
MTIEIVDIERITDEEGEFWIAWLEITQASQTWALPTTAPGTLAKADLQPHFDAREAHLWQVAQTKQYPADVYERLPDRRILKAFVAVVFDEINILRQQHSLPDRTAAQVEAAIKAKLK